MFALGIKNISKIVTVLFTQEKAKKFLSKNPEEIDSLIDKVCVQLSDEYETMLDYGDRGLSDTVSFPIHDNLLVIMITFEEYETKDLIAEASLEEPGGEMINRLLNHVSIKIQQSFDHENRKPRPYRRTVQHRHG